MPDKENRQRYRLTVTLLEDMHTGTGTGSAYVDAVQKRDRRGLPLIRATHYKGVLRDHAREIVVDEPDLKLQVRTLFGEDFNDGGPNQRGALILESLYLEPWSGADSCLVWSSTARQLGQRAPMPQTLRSREFIPAGSVFAGKVLLREASHAGLLKRCVRRMDALGAERQRGSGLVQVKWEPDLVPDGGRTAVVAPGIKSAGRVRLRLILLNLDPLCLPITGYAGNLIRTDCYIRGQRLLGALAGWAKDTGADPALLFRYGSGDVCIGNAYPLPEGLSLDDAGLSSWDLIPFPLQLKTRKPKPLGDADWPWWADSDRGVRHLDARIVDDLGPKKVEPEEKPKRPKDHEFLFRSGEDKAWIRYEPMVQYHLRNQVPEDRSGEEEGELFSAEEIAEKTRFLVDIEFADAHIAKEFAETFSPVIWHSDWLAVGRGGRPVVVEDYCWLTPQHGGSDRDKQTGSTEGCEQGGEFSFSVLLESDLLARAGCQYERLEPGGGRRLVRLPNLGFCDTLDPALLMELASVDQESIPEFRDWVWKATTDTVEVRGYNAATRLPRSPALAIRRGSAIRVSGKQAKRLFDALCKLPYLGERGREGFGRFRLFEGNFPCESNHSDVRESAMRFEHASMLAVRERILGEAKKLADRIMTREACELPSRAQWMDLRTLVRVSPNLQGVVRQMQEHGNKRGGAKWEKAGLDVIQEKLGGFGEKTEDARLFLDSLIRWLLSHDNMKRVK